MLCVLSAVMVGVLGLMSLILNQAVVPAGWETFTSDLVVGIITTGGLGLLLWWFTRRIDRDAGKRENLQLARVRWAVVVRRVAMIVNTEDFEANVLDASDLGPIARDLVALLQDEPLTEWSSTLALEEISQVNSALHQLETALALGRRLNSAIRFAFSVSRRRSTQPLKAFQSAFVGQSLGLGLDATTAAFKIKGKQQAKFLEDVERMRSSDLDQRIFEYSLMRKSAEDRVDRLRTQVNRSAIGSDTAGSPLAEGTA